MKQFKGNKLFNKSTKGKEAYLTISFQDGGRIRKIMTEVIVIGEKHGKAIVTTDYKKIAAVDKWLLMDKENYDRERQMLIGKERKSSVEDQMYLNLVHDKGVCTQPFLARSNQPFQEGY